MSLTLQLDDKEAKAVNEAIWESIDEADDSGDEEKIITLQAVARRLENQR